MSSPTTSTAAGAPARPDRDRIAGLREAARRIRHHALDMGEVQGQGYIGQALGVADVLAVVYEDQLRFRPDDPHWPERDRFLLSIGHYAIALYAALAEAGVIDVAELETYGADGSRLPMSGMASYTPGMEISGGSLGHGLGVATGMALGLRHQGSPARVYNLLSDGELDEGSTWEAALACAHHALDNVTAALADAPSPTYLRLLRGAVPTVLDEYDYRFELGTAAELRTGRDVLLVSTGLMTMRALDAARRLEADHLDVAVLHVPAIKPLDRDAILRETATDRLVVTRENHTIVGGLAESVASCVAFAGQTRRIVPIALPDEFLAAGALPTLDDRYGLSADAVVARIKAELDA